MPTLQCGRVPLELELLVVPLGLPRAASWQPFGGWIGGPTLAAPVVVRNRTCSRPGMVAAESAGAAVGGRGEIGPRARGSL
jgi:hypothetical protein